MGNSEQLAVELATSLSSLTTASTTLADANTSLSSAATSFTSIVQKIELRFKDLATWEESLVERKKMLDELSTALEEREATLKRSESEVMRKLNELSNREQVWATKEAKMKENIASLADTVTLNIGGGKFTMSKQLLCKYNDSFFTTMLQTNHNNKDKFFIERDPKYFATVANFLRDGKLNKKIKLTHIADLEEEFAFYRIPFPEFETEIAEKQPEQLESRVFDPAGKLLTIEHRKVVCSWIPNSHFLLLYKGTNNGFSPGAYHERCDARGPLFVVIRSTEGHLFGGYTLTQINHDSPGQTERHTIHPESFLFTLSNPHNLSPTTFPLLPGIWPTLYTPFENAHLGWGRWGYDLALSTHPQTDKKSYVGFPYAFRDKVGHGKLTFTGNEYFTIKDIEVFSVVPAYSNPTPWYAL